jgi:hypothetical protein
MQAEQTREASGTKDASVASEVREARGRPRLQQRGFASFLSLKVVFNFLILFSH